MATHAIETKIKEIALLEIRLRLNYEHWTPQAEEYLSGVYENIKKSNDTPISVDSEFKQTIIDRIEELLRPTHTVNENTFSRIIQSVDGDEDPNTEEQFDLMAICFCGGPFIIGYQWLINHRQVDKWSDGDDDFSRYSDTGDIKEFLVMRGHSWLALEDRWDNIHSSFMAANGYIGIQH